MILSFLQHHSLNKNLKYWEEDLGVLLTDFFDFYGEKNREKECWLVKGQSLIIEERGFQ